MRKFEQLLAVHMHMSPRVVDTLTVAEFLRFCAHAEEINNRYAEG